MPLYPNAGCLAIGGLLQAALPNCQLRLTKESLAIGPTTTRAALVAIEADFSGYAAIVVAAALAPFLDSLGGVSVTIPTQQWNFDGTDLTPTTNTVYAWWLELDDDTLIAAGVFDAPIPMESAGQSIPLGIELNLCRDNAIVATLSV